MRAIITTPPGTTLADKAATRPTQEEVLLEFIEGQKHLYGEASRSILTAAEWTSYLEELNSKSRLEDLVDLFRGNKLKELFANKVERLTLNILNDILVGTNDERRYSSP